MPYFRHAKVLTLHSVVQCGGTEEQTEDYNDHL